MIILLLLLLAEIPSSTTDMWALRAGFELDQAPPVPGAWQYLSANRDSETGVSCEELEEAVTGGDISMIVPLTSLLVAEGREDTAVIYWEMSGLDVPATRNDVLNALAWFGRYQLYPVMALKPPVPGDMTGTMHAEQCAAVCALGWMSVREDGLFHPEDMASRFDIRLLAQFFPLNSDLNYIPISILEDIFRNTTATGAVQ